MDTSLFFVIIIRVTLGRLVMIVRFLCAVCVLGQPRQQRLLLFLQLFVLPLQLLPRLHVFCCSASLLFEILCRQNRNEHEKSLASIYDSVQANSVHKLGILTLLSSEKNTKNDQQILLLWLM